MGSPHTLDPRQHHQQPTTPAERAAATADDLYRRANPDRVHIANHPHPLARHELVRGMEDLETRGYRAWNHQTQENWPTPADWRQAAIRQRATAAQLSTDRAEQAFDRLNPTFGVPADTTSPYGHRDVQQREAALALGTRVAVAASRENDRDPGIWLGGQDYRVADAIHHARTHPIHVRRPVERVGAER